MNTEKYLLSVSALLLVWSIKGEAHSSIEAMQQSGSLLHLIAAFLHPLLEQPWLIFGPTGGLLVAYMLGRGLKIWLSDRKTVMADSE